MSETVFGERIHQGRILRQRKLADLADQLGCSVPTLSKWENAGAIEISDYQASILTGALKFSPSFFTSRPTPPLVDSDLLFKAPKSTLKREVNWLKEFVRLTAELLDWMDQRRHLPPVKIQPRSPVSLDIPQAARDLRSMLGISNSCPIEYLTHPVERAGIVVAVRRPGLVDGGWNGPVSRPDTSSEERHEGCSTWAGQFRERPLIVMRGVPTWEKTRWVLAHELGHLCLHAGRMPVSEEAEEQASRFASELLAPVAEVVKNLPPVVTLAALVDVKFRWGISLAALVRHLHANGVITDQRKRTLYDQLYTRKNPETGRSFGVTEPGWNKRTPERPGLISAWLQRITGSVAPEVISATVRFFPPDLLGSVLNEQRNVASKIAQTAVPEKKGNSTVVYLGLRAGHRSNQRLGEPVLTPSLFAESLD